MTCAACEDTIPCVNNYLTFGASGDNTSIQEQLVTRIALTQSFPIHTEENIVAPTQSSETTTLDKLEESIVSMV